MLNQATLDKLHALRLTGMAEAYQKQLEEPEARGLNFEERFGMLVDSHWTWRENLALTRRLKKSKLSSEPCVEDINYRYPRQMDPSTMRGLTNSQWVAQHLNVLFTGPTGIGKTWLGQALAQKACRDGYSVLYRSAAKLFRDLAQGRADGSLGRLLESIARTDVLLVDDFAMAPLSDDERRSFLEVCDDQSVACRELACADRRSNHRRQHPGPAGSQRLSHRDGWRVDTQEEEGCRGGVDRRPLMSAPRLILKQPTGWFAAGREFTQAIAILSDGAFKLYVYACLRAGRHTGCLRATVEELARARTRAPTAIAMNLDELEERAVCRVIRNGGSQLVLEIRDRFWPYQRQQSSERTLGPETEFVDRVRDLFLAPACVQASFSAADEKLALGMHRRGVSMEQIKRAILLG
jgi:DNA replication protein DnaC